MTLDRVSFVTASDDSLGTVLSTPHHAHADNNVLVVFVRCASDELVDITVSDTFGNPFHLATRVLDAGGAGQLSAFYTQTIAGDPLNVVTATWAVAKAERRMTVVEYTGTAATGVLEAFVSGSGNGSTAFSSAINTENPNNILVMGIATDSGAVFTAGPDFTLEGSVPNLGVVDHIVVDVQNGSVATALLDASYSWLVIVLAITDTESVTPSAGLSGFASFAFEVDWGNNGIWVDETSRLLDLPKLRRGRNRANPLNGRSDPGELQALLDNRSGRFSPFYSGGGLSGTVLPSRRCRFRITEPVAVTRFTGFIKSITPASQGALPVVTINAQGPTAWFAGKQVNPPANAGALTGKQMITILDYAGWPGTNVETNGDFEANVTGWATSGSNTIAQSSAQAKYGTGSCKATYNNGGGGDTNVMFHAVTLPAVGVYTWSCWVWVPTAFSGSQVIVTEEGVAGATGVLYGAANLALRDQWQRLTWTFTAVTGGLSGFIVARMVGASNGQFIYVDGVQIEKGSAATTFMRRQIDAGQVTTSRWYLPKDKDPLEAAREIEETEPGFLLEAGNGDIVFQDKNYRITGARTTSQATYSDAPGATYPYLRGIEEGDSLPDIINEVLATVTPYTVNAIADLWTLTGETPTLGPGQSKTWFAEFPSPGSALGSQGAYVETWTTPVVGTDLTQTGVANGDIAVAAVVAATTLIITVTNNHVSNTATITLLKARGTAVLKGTPTTVRSQDTTSQGKYGQRTYRNPPKWLPTTNVAQDYCDGLVLVNKEPIPPVRVPFLANLSQLLFTELMNRDISDRVTLVAMQPSTGLYISADFFVEAMEDRYDVQRGRYEVSLELSLAASNNSFWVLGTSVLDTSTILGY